MIRRRLQHIRLHRHDAGSLQSDWSGVQQRQPEQQQRHQQQQRQQQQQPERERGDHGHDDDELGDGDPAAAAAGPPAQHHGTQADMSAMFDNVPRLLKSTHWRSFYT